MKFLVEVGKKNKKSSHLINLVLTNYRRNIMLTNYRISITYSSTLCPLKSVYLENTTIKITTLTHRNSIIVDHIHSIHENNLSLLPSTLLFIFTAFKEYGGKCTTMFTQRVVLVRELFRPFMITNRHVM